MTLKTVVNVTRMKYTLIAYALYESVLTPFWSSVNSVVFLTLEPNTIATIFGVCISFWSSL